MKNLFVVCAVAALLAAWGAAAQATVTITFDPDDLIQAAPDSPGMSDVLGENKATQLDARRLHQPWSTKPLHETFYNPADPQPQPDNYNTYMNWRESLGEGEGIAMINTWFLNNGAAKTWGETVVVKPHTTVTGTTADGWNMRVIEDPYNLGGACVQWWTTDSSKYINTLSDIGDFSITADLYWDVDANGWDENDPAVVAGESVRFWAGNLNGDDPEFYLDETQALYFDDQGWGTRTTNAGGPFEAIYSTGSGHQGSGFEAAMTAKATAVPEPATLVLCSLLGLTGLVIRNRRR
jgi:hypothetical protein